MSDLTRETIKRESRGRLGDEQIMAALHFLWGDAKEGTCDKTLWDVFRAHLEQLLHDRRVLDKFKEIFEREER